jgi:hypothetical protein
MSAQTLAENVMAIAENAVPKIPRKWANVQVVGLKTPESMSLPIYNKTPETLLEIAAMAGYNPPKASTNEEIDVPEREFGGANKSNDSKAEAAKKRKGDLKSPLVRALKKQKKVEEEEKTDKKQKRTAEDVVMEDKPKESPTKKQKKEVAKKVEEVKPESAKKQKKEAKVETPKETKKQKETSAKKSEEVKPDSAKKANKEEDNKDFIAAKKFKGSKKGYAFKMGKQGVGYYVDVKPTIDKMAIQAIMKLKNSRGSQSKNKYKGSRKF